MNARCRAGVTSRWWFSGSAAVVVHGMVAFALPDTPPRQALSSAEPVSFSLTSDGAHSLAVAGRTDSQAVVGRADSKVAAASRHASKRTRARPATAQTTDGASQAPSSATSQAASVSATEPRPAARDTAAESAGELASSAHGKGVGDASPGLGGGVVRGPGLLPVASPCRGFFPLGATADHGEVQIDVHVDASGRAHFHRLLAETPRGQGFGSAAAACAAALRFAPARNHAGIAIAGNAKLELRFDRS